MVYLQILPAYPSGKRLYHSRKLGTSSSYFSKWHFIGNNFWLVCKYCRWCFLLKDTHFTLFWDTVLQDDSSVKLPHIFCSVFSRILFLLPNTVPVVFISAQDAPLLLKWISHPVLTWWHQPTNIIGTVLAPQFPLCQRYLPVSAANRQTLITPLFTTMPFPQYEVHSCSYLVTSVIEILTTLLLCADSGSAKPGHPIMCASIATMTP